MIHKIEVDQRKLFLCGFLDMWGIRGNETADRAAKEASEKEPIDDLMTF